MTKFYKQNLKKTKQRRKISQTGHEKQKKSKVTKPQQQNCMMIRNLGDRAKQRNVCSCDLTLFVEISTEEGQFLSQKKL